MSVVSPINSSSVLDSGSSAAGSSALEPDVLDDFSGAEIVTSTSLSYKP